MCIALPYLNSNSNSTSNNGYPILSENIRPSFEPAKYPALQYAEDDYVPKFPSRSNNLQHSKDYHQIPDYSAAPIDPFYDAPITASNVGRRRANAIHLVNSPARVSHSQGLARIYQKAQETIRFQDEAAKRAVNREKPVLSTSTPRRRNVAGNDCHSDSRVPPLRYDDNVVHRKPVASPVVQPKLPEWEPLGRLSDDIPPELRTQSSIPRPLRVRPTQSTKHFVPPPLKLSKSPSTVIRSPRRRAGNESMDSGIAMSPALARQNATSDAGDGEEELDGFDPSKHIDTPMPHAQPFEDPVAKRVATWLDNVDGSPLPAVNPKGNLMTDSPMEAFYQLQAETPENLNAGIKTPSISSSKSSHEIRDKHSSTISKLMCIQPLRLRFPSSSSSKLGFQTLATPPRRFKIPARVDSQSGSSTLHSRHASNSSKSRSFTTANGPKLSLIHI